MGGVAKLIKKNPKIFKKVEPENKKEVVKKEIDKEQKADQIKLANKRKGRRSTILTNSSGLNEEEVTKKKMLLG